MQIYEMSKQDSIDQLARRRLGRLACSCEGQPYIIPIYYVYDDNCLYSFSTLGQKISWMRANPLVCFESDEVISPQEWTTIVILGRYEELPDTPQHEDNRKRAYGLLQAQALWWEPGYVKTMLDNKPRPMEPLYFRIHINELTGHRGSRSPNNEFV